MCCGDDGQWNPDPNITCAKAQASQDQFVLLRVQVEEDLQHYGLMDSSSLKQLWRKLDKNGNNNVSLAEIDLLVQEMVKTGTWPQWLNNKQSMQRAYEKTTKMDDNDGDDFVEKEEFHSLLLNLFWFGHLHQLFDDVDTDDDDKINLSEFMQGMQKLGLQLSEREAEAEYRTIDMDQGGQILFTEFCSYVRNRIHPDHNPAFDAEVVSRDKSSDTLRKKHGAKATHGQFVQKKSMADFDALEKKIKGMMNNNDELRKIWNKLDFNNNRIVSLAEVDKMVNEQFPLLNHKPALMRAFQSTLRDGDKDDWVEKHEFKMLLGNLFYFNKLFWLFDQVDEDKDRRMTFKEFKWCLSVCGLNMSDSKCQAEFKKVDVNGGGIILFDEFCRYFTDKHCPNSMTEFVDAL
jgi:Ca2+-binding EF-hand superfamily protein